MAIGTPVSIGTTTSSTATNSFNLTTSGAVPAGARVCVAVGWASPTTARTLTFSGGSLSWAQDKALTGTDGGGVFYGLSWWSAIAAAGLASSTVLNAAFSGNTFGVNIGALYAAGIASSSYIDGTPPGTFRSPGTASWASGTVATANADDLLLGAAFSDDFAVNTSTATGSATELQDFGDATNNWALTTTYRIVAATSTYGATGTWASIPDFADAAIMVAYKADAGGGGVTVKNLAVLGVG